MEPPGRWSRIREPLLATIGDFAASAARGIRPYLDKPFAFFGHSVGALVAFELARQLRRDLRLEPVHLTVAARRAPQLVPPVVHPPIHGLSDPAFVESLSRHYGNMPQAILDDPELLEVVVRITRADYRALETYAYVDEPPLACRILALGGRRDPMATEPDLAAWRAQSSCDSTVRIFSGDHFFLVPEQALVLSAIADALGQISS
jgi:medium-chain acyl-[acyl-carrier-protein] hydrolase